MNEQTKGPLALWPFRVRPFPLERLPLNPVRDFPYTFFLLIANIYPKFRLVTTLNSIYVSNENVVMNQTFAVSNDPAFTNFLNEVV